MLIHCAAGDGTYAQLRKGYRISHELVKDMYNTLGEVAVVGIINFEEEGLNGFKAKYIQVGNKLY